MDINKPNKSIVYKIAIPVIIVGIFVIIVFVALNPTQLNLNFYIVFSLVCVFLFFYGVSEGQKLSSPVKKLLKRAVELSGGDLTARVYLDSKDEFEELARLFNKIAEELERSRAETKTTENSVDIKVKAKTESLNETINALEQKVKNRTIELEKLLAESNALQTKLKSKESETSQLNKELNSFKQKVSRRTK